MAAELTVVVPTRNRRPILAVTLASILASTEVDLEVVVVDEASTDDTAAWLDAHPDPRVRVLRTDPPRGVGGARNAGLEAARAPRVAFSDDDDVWVPERARRLLDVMGPVHDPAAGLAAGGAVAVGGDDFAPRFSWRPPPAGEVPDRLRSTNVLPGGGSAVIADAGTMRAIGGFRVDLPAAEDWECWLRLSERTPVAIVDEPLLAYRISAGSHSHDVSRMLAGVRQVRELHDLPRHGPWTEPLTSFLSLQAARSGSRRATVGWHLRRAAQRRSPTDLALAVGGALCPRWVVSLREAADLRGFDAEWAAPLVARLAQLMRP